MERGNEGTERREGDGRKKEGGEEPSLPMKKIVPAALPLVLITYFY